MYLRQCFSWHKHQRIDRVKAFGLQLFYISRCDPIHLFHCARKNSFVRHVLRLKVNRCVQCAHKQQANTKNSFYKPEVWWSIVDRILLLHHCLWLFEPSIFQLHFEPWFPLVKIVVIQEKNRNLSVRFNVCTMLFSVCHFMFCNGKSRSDWNVWMRCVCARVFVFCALLMLPFDVAHSATATHKHLTQQREPIEANYISTHRHPIQTHRQK